MRALHYLIAVDESFDWDDCDRAWRFLHDVVSVAPAADIGCVVRLTRLLPQTSTPITGDGLPAVPQGPSVFTRFCRLDAAEETRRGPRSSHDQPASELSFDEAWARFWGLLNRSGSANLFPDNLDNLNDLNGRGDAPRFDAIICLHPGRGEAATLTGSDLLVCQLASWTNVPIWRCSEPYRGITRVVLAATGCDSDDRLSEAAQSVAEALSVPLAAVCAGHVSSRGRLWSSWPIRRCRHTGEVAACLEYDELLVMGAYGRSWPARLFSASSTQTILAGVRGPALVLRPQ